LRGHTFGTVDPAVNFDDARGYLRNAIEMCGLCYWIGKTDRDVRYGSRPTDCRICAMSAFTPIASIETGIHPVAKCHKQTSSNTEQFVFTTCSAAAGAGVGFCAGGELAVELGEE
jgi:hypothetical protein